MNLAWDAVPPNSRSRTEGVPPSWGADRPTAAVLSTGTAALALASTAALLPLLRAGIPLAGRSALLPFRNRGAIVAEDRTAGLQAVRQPGADLADFRLAWIFCSGQVLASRECRAPTFRPEQSFSSRRAVHRRDWNIVTLRLPGHTPGPAPGEARLP